MCIKCRSRGSPWERRHPAWHPACLCRQHYHRWPRNLFGVNYLTVCKHRTAFCKSLDGLTPNRFRGHFRLCHRQLLTVA